MEEKIFELLLKMQSDMCDMRASIEQRLDALEERVEALEEKMDILDAREDRHYELLQASIGDSYHGLKSIHSTMHKQVERLDEKKVDKEALRSIC